MLVRETALVPSPESSPPPRTPTTLWRPRSCVLPRRTFEALDGDDRLAEVEADDGPALGAGGEALRRMVVRHRRRDQRQRGR